MDDFIEVTALRGAKRLINKRFIKSVIKENGGSVIYFSANDALFNVLAVKESYREIAAILTGKHTYKAKAESDCICDYCQNRDDFKGCGVACEYWFNDVPCNGYENFNGLYVEVIDHE